MKQIAAAAARRRLLDRRREVLLRYKSENARADEEQGNREAEEIEHATELWDATVLGNLSEVDARILAQVIEALRRLEQGTYGTCIDCGKRISRARLGVIPEAALCVDCANEAEAVVT